MSARRVEVALPLPVQTSFSYLVPEAQPSPARGARVRVPFGARRVIGVVTGDSPAGEPRGALREIEAVLDETPLPPAPLVELAGWVAEHYLAPPGEAYRLVLPPAGVRASRAVARLAEAPAPGVDDPLVALLRKGPLPVSTLARRLGRDPSAGLVRLRHAGIVAIEQSLAAGGFREVTVAVRTRGEARASGPAQAALVARLEAAGGRLAVAELVRERPSWRGALRRLVAAGSVVLERVRERRAPEVLPARAAEIPEPSSDQRGAIAALATALDARRFGAFLLHGVTASGKTEVYFQAIERALDGGRGALLLVPEIALTPLLVRAAVARFGETVSVLHSELSVGERHDEWWRIREGDSRVVVGARSAVFAPLADVGLIVVDEEHEAAYKQEESPRYHARDVAVVRATLEGAVAVLGSATPAVESYANARRGKYVYLALPGRVTRAALPRVEVVDRRRSLQKGDDRVLSEPLRAALVACLGRGEQAIVLLNRRGYATSLLCRECGAPALCPNCSVSLTLHERGRRAQCHYCGHEQAAATRCDGCRGEYLRLTGFGTERVVEAVEAAVPGARVARLDRDLAAARGAVARVLAGFEAGESDVLVGTQMIAKGHDFPKVTLVGVVDADVGLGLPDFRSAERTLQLLTQVAGRAGRRDVAGTVVLQTHQPDHYALRLACAQDYAAFFERELEFRRTLGYPPALALVNIVLRAAELAHATGAAEALAARLRPAAGRRFRVLGPAAAPLARLRGEHRVQLLLKGDRAAMRQAVRESLVELYGPVRWPGVAVDVDPLSVL